MVLLGQGDVIREWAKITSRASVPPSRAQASTSGTVDVGWIMIIRDVYVVLAFELSRERRVGRTGAE